jgi:NADPH:quinone reductase-like Zn-dependent oxidoreductase
MKAAYFNEHGGREKIIVGELARPEPQSGQIQVQVKFSATNHLDIWVRKGWPGLKLNFPHIVGEDASGVVTRLGEGCQSFREGDEVIVHPGISCGECEHCLQGLESLCSQYVILGEQISGTHAQYVCVPEANLFLKPKNISFEEAAALPLVFTTAWQMLVERAKIKASDKVLIHGAGSGVSTAAVQIAKFLGAEVAVTSTQEKKLEKAKALGADHLIHAQRVDFSKEIKSFWPQGPEIIIDHVGQLYWEKNIRCLKTGGTLVTCGATSGPEGKTDLRHLFFRQLSLLGSTMGNKKDFRKILNGVETGKLKAVIDRVFELKDTARAQEYLESGEQFGKVMVKVSQ